MKQHHTASAPLMPGQQAGYFGRQHAESRADRGERDDTAVFQLLADQHPRQVSKANLRRSWGGGGRQRHYRSSLGSGRAAPPVLQGCVIASEAQ